MKLTYIYHSGFAVESGSFIIIIDFFKDTEGLRKGIVYNKFLKSGKKIYVLSSHSHIDHFNRNILQWKEMHPDICYIFSGDILEEKMAGEKDAVYLEKSGTYSDGNIRVKAFGSTDIGISFLIQCEGKLIFHAGDLNNWHWNEESSLQEIQEAENNYLAELQSLKEETNYLDVAMFPVDKRLGKDYMRGAEQLISTIRTDVFVPMHFSQEYQSANAFKEYAVKKGCRFFEIHAKGDTIEI